MLTSSLHGLSSFFLLDFHHGKSLGLKTDLILHLIFLFHSKLVLSLLLLVLLLDHLGLLCLLFLLEQEGVLNFLLFVISLFREHVVLLAHLSLLFIVQLDIKDLLLDLLLIPLLKS